MKTNEELLKYIEKLENENEVLRKLHDTDQKRIYDQDLKLQEQSLKLQEQDLKIYETNKKLEEALLIIQNYEEKYNIERTRIFIPKTEKLESIVINETEDVIKKQRKTNKGKKYKKYNQL